MEQNTKQKSALVKRIDNSPKEVTHKSWLDTKFGTHTTPLIVAVLFVVTLIAYLVIICVKGNISDNTLSGMKDLLLVLGSVFTGTQLRK